MNINNCDAAILDLLERVTGSSEVRANPDISLFEEALLDSFGLAELIVAISDELKIPVALGEVEYSEWATPRKIISFFEQRARA
jgi:D-alanine--poly(phosphoribitol) ligase subunit 2